MSGLWFMAEHHSHQAEQRGETDWSQHHTLECGSFWFNTAGNIETSFYNSRPVNLSRGKLSQREEQLSSAIYVHVRYNIEN